MFAYLCACLRGYGGRMLIIHCIRLLRVWYFAVHNIIRPNDVYCFVGGCHYRNNRFRLTKSDHVRSLCEFIEHFSSFLHSVAFQM